MSEEAITEILVTYDAGQLTFEDLETGGLVDVDPTGHLKVPKGDHWIRFRRLAGTAWSFCGFRYKAEPADHRGPITSITLTSELIEILDANHHDAQENRKYQYEIQIRTPKGELIWVDPVIENKSGGGSGSGG